MKKTLALLLALMMCLSMAACGGGGDAGDATDPPSGSSDANEPGGSEPGSGNATEISLWHYFENEGPLLEEMIAEYNELQSDIHITATFMSRDELMNQYTVGALSGQLPDIGMVDSPDMASYVELGVFEDITSQLEAWGELDKVYPGPLSSTQDADGKYYGLPQNTNCLALACNMDMLAEAGFDHAPTSLDEFVEMCAAATNTAEGIYGYAMCCVSNEEGTFQLLSWLRSTYNGKSVNVDELTAESSVHGLSVLADLVKNGYMSKEVVNWTQSDAMNQFMAGKCAMFEAGTWHLFNFDENNLSEKFNYKVVLLPTGDEGTSTSTIGGENLGVCTGAADVDACVDFLTWFMSAENQTRWAEQASKIPIRSDSTPSYPYEQENFAVFQDEMNYALARGPHAEWPSISTAIYTAAQSAFVDGADPADALAAAAATIEPIVSANPLPDTHQLD